MICKNFAHYHFVHTNCRSGNPSSGIRNIRQLQKPLCHPIFAVSAVYNRKYCIQTANFATIIDRQKHTSGLRCKNYLAVSIIFRFCSFDFFYWHRTIPVAFTRNKQRQYFKFFRIKIMCNGGSRYQRYLMFTGTAAKQQPYFLFH